MVGSQGKSEKHLFYSISFVFRLVWFALFDFSSFASLFYVSCEKCQNMVNSPCFSSAMKCLHIKFTLEFHNGFKTPCVVTTIHRIHTDEWNCVYVVFC